MHRFYTVSDHSPENVSSLSAEDAHHALNVLRLRPGSEIEIIENGTRFAAVIDAVDGGNVTVRKTKRLPSAETTVSFTLFQGLPKGDKMELIVQKAVELGVSRIIPVTMSRCVVRLSEKDALRKQERWMKIARESVKQCGRCVVPEISLPVPLRGISSYRDLVEELVVPWENADHYGPKAFIRDHPDIRSLGILIGPEGGIDSEEMKYLSGLSAQSLTLGRRILRTETAGLAAVSAFSALLGEME